MNKGIVAAIIVACIANAAIGQNIDLRGVVKNSGGSPIAGVVVKLMSSGIADTTDSQGKFQIKPKTEVGAVLPQTQFKSFDPFFIMGKGVQFSQPTPGLVHLQIFDLTGKTKSDMKVQLGAGIWQLNPDKLSSGIYLARLETVKGVQNFQFSIFNSAMKSDVTSLLATSAQAVRLHKVAATVDSLQTVKALYATKITKLSSLIDSSLVINLDTAIIPTGSGLPGDIAAAAGTPLVAAHSMIRALYKAYSGKLFQVRRASDGKTQDITPATTGGPVDLSALKTFLNGTTGTVAMIYDQAGNQNDLPQTSVANQMDLQYWTSPTGVQVPMAVTPDKDKYLRNRTNTKKMPVGAAPQTMYFVVYTKIFNANCCWDYGNMELVAKVSSTNTAGKMAALNIGTKDNGYANPGAGTGPWGMIDYEAGVYSGSYSIGQVNPNNPSLTWPIATVLSKCNGTTSWALKVGDVSKGTLTTSWNGALPPRGYNPLHQEGGLSLGEGGDGSKKGSGAFFEGVIIADVTSDATDNAIQAGLTNTFK